MVAFVSLPKHLAHGLMDAIEAAGVPVVMLRGNGEVNPDGVRDYDLLVPASAEAFVVDRFSDSRTSYLRDAAAWREAFVAEHGVIPPPTRP
jgi:hypothetical protein